MASAAPPPVPPRPEATRPGLDGTAAAVPDNQTMFQGFEWYVPADHAHWRRLRHVLPGLEALGITSLWVPPACKASWRTGNGYDVYDLYDLGEFDQKGSTPTKWGSKEELQVLVADARRRGIGVLFDAVLNHKAAADHSETVLAKKVDDQDRNVVEEDTKPIEAWCRYDFPGRGNAYSPLKWDQQHFNGIDYDQTTQRKGVWKFEGKEWAQDVDEELGNYDYLMFSNIDHAHPAVRRDLLHWTTWLSGQLPGLGGLRLDAVKHYSADFARDLVRHVDAAVPGGRDWLLVGEYWREDADVLARYAEYVGGGGGRLALFDVRLVMNFSRLSFCEGDSADLRTVFDGALMTIMPENAVTFVANHDTMVGQSLEAPVVEYFLPLAYALILLRSDTGIPCVFYGDLYGHYGPTTTATSSPSSSPSDFAPPPFGGSLLPRLVLARKLYAYGPQVNYFDDDPRCVGFTRLGLGPGSGGGPKAAGLAVVMTNAWTRAAKRMFVGAHRAGQRWTDVLRGCWGEVVIDGEGWGVFPAAPRSVAVWAAWDAPGRREVVDGSVFDSDIYGRAQGRPQRPITAGELYTPRLRTQPAWMGAGTVE